MPGGNQTRLASLIKKACNPHNVEPDIQVALEVCELVNSKTSYAHLACTEVSNYFKVEDEIQCLLALFLLDMLVINCGYPVHLSISKREFLNKLMYRFPPGPQFQTDKTHEFILQMLNKWCIALCERSKYRNEFGNIRLMYSLIKSKNFVMPPVEESDIQAILGVEESTSELKTMEEILGAERKVQEAKLEDLLRKGTPADLRAANELMKVMSGYMDRGYQGVDSTIANSLLALEEKKRLLEELLWNNNASDYAQNDSIQQLLGDFRIALPKLEKMAQSELPEATLSKVIEAFQAIHDLVNQASGSKDPQEVQDKFSLIQFGDEEPTVGSVKKQSIFLEEPESTFDTSIERKMTLSGSGVIVDVFEKKDMLIFVLLNHSNSEMNLNKLILGDRKVLEFPTIPQYTAVSVSTTHRWEDFAMLPITWTFETDFGTPASINLIKTK